MKGNSTGWNTMLSGQGIQISDLSICIDWYCSLSSLGLQSQVAKTHEEGIQAENLDGYDSFSQVEKVGKETLQKYCHFITCKLYPRKYEIHLKISDVQREWVNNFWPFYQEYSARGYRVEWCFPNPNFFYPSCNVATNNLYRTSPSISHSLG